MSFKKAWRLAESLRTLGIDPDAMSRFYGWMSRLGLPIRETVFSPDFPHSHTSSKMGRRITINDKPF
jgi:hypothetical protein